MKRIAIATIILLLPFSLAPYAGAAEPAAPAEGSEIARLIEQLGSTEFSVRERASRS